MKTNKILLIAIALMICILALNSCEFLHVHDWNEATCTAPKTCSECGATEGEALGHTEKPLTGKQATCTEAGLTEGKVCAVCEEIIEAQEEISPLGHNEVSHAAQEPTCTVGGWDAYVSCSRCDYTTKVEKSPIEHSYTNYVSNEDATCSKDGTKTANCDYECGASDTIADENSKVDHSYTNYVSNGDATCSKDGTKTANCDYECGASDTIADENSKVDHKYTLVSNENGTHTVGCENCDYIGETTECSLLIVGNTEPVYGVPGRIEKECEKCGYTTSEEHTTLSYTLGSASVAGKDFIATSSNFSGNTATLPKGKVVYLGERVFAANSQFILSADITLSNPGTDNWLQFEIQDGTEKLLFGVNVTFIENDLFNLRIAGTQADGTTLGNKYIADASFLYDKTTKEAFTSVPAWSSALAKKIDSENTTLNIAVQRELVIGLDGSTTVAMYTVFVNGQKLISFHESTCGKTIALGGSNASDTAKYDFTMKDFVVGISTSNVEAVLSNITVDTKFEKANTNVVNGVHTLTDGTVSSTASANPSVADSVLVNAGKESYLGNLKLDSNAEFELTTTVVLTNTDGKGFGFTIHNGTTKMDFMIMCGKTDGYYRTRVRVNGSGFYYADDNYVYGNGTDTCPTSQWNSAFYFKNTDLVASNGITVTLKREADTFREIATYKYSIIIGGETVAYWYQNTSGNVQYTVNGVNKEAKSIDVTISNEFAVGFITDGVAARFYDITFEEK